MAQPFLVRAEKHRYQRIQCSLADFFVARTSVSVAFFYQTILPQEKLIHALEKIVTDFPIFAGVLIKKNHQLYIDCINQGIQMRIEHLPQRLSMRPDLSTLDTSVLVDRIHPGQTLKYQKPLFTIRLRYHPNGMTIGYSWHHTLGDMATFMAFLNAFSLCFQGQPYALPLIVEDREDYLEQRLRENGTYTKKNRIENLRYMSITDILGFIKHICLPKKSLFLYFDKPTIEQLKENTQASVRETLSRSDVICAHVLSLILECRRDKAKKNQASITINFRQHLGLDALVLGNYIDMLPIRFGKHESQAGIASLIRRGVTNYEQEYLECLSIKDYLEKFDELKKLNRVLPTDLMPKYKNLIISNWSNFGIYSIDFGVQAPELFLPIGNTTFPWRSCIVEGPNNNGLLMAMVLPRAVAKRLEKMSPTLTRPFHP